VIEIETGRLILRNFKLEDAQSLREMIVQKEASPYAEYDQECPTSEDEIRGITEWFAGGDSYLAICLKETGKLIGFICLNPADDKDSRAFDLGYCFNSDYHGQGYATEGAQAVVDYAFTGLKADCLTSGTAAANSPSCRLLDRLGFKKTGQGTAAFRKTPDGKPVEFVGWGFALSRENWVKSK
jgi:[ribosomal protein S5]-alanine N-acetyltransferase